MKYYVYAGYYENFISGHKLPKPYTLRDEFKTFDEALDYVWENWEDDAIFFTEDVIGDAIDNGFIDDENWENYLMKESKKSATKSIKESKNDIDFNNLNGFVNFKEYGDSSRGGGAFSEIKKLFEKDSSFQYIVSLIKDLESDFELTKFTFSPNGEINISFKEVGGNFEFFVKYEIVRSGIGLTNLRYF